MSENKPHKQKNENMKTETSFSGKFGQVQFGKLVRLPYIRKISTNAHNTTLSRKSLECKDTRIMRTSNKQLNLLEQTQMNMLTLQQIELCNEGKEKEGFPRINLALPFGRERSNESLEKTCKERFEKSMTKMELGEQLGEYRLGPVIGRGTYSIVRAGRSREGKKVAVKTYLKSALSSEDRRKNLENEVAVLSSIEHACILKFRESVQTQQSTSIVTQLYENRSLADYMKSECFKTVGEEVARVVLRQLVRAVAYLHGGEIVHRDLKLENVLVSREMKIKLIDFGFSRRLPKENYVLYDFCGTPHYIAPEVIQREGYYGKPADIWSLGVLLYRMVAGSFPFKGLNEKNIYSKVMKAELKLPNDLSPELSSLLTDMLSFDFRKRPTAEELLSSRWLQK